MCADYFNLWLVQAARWQAKGSSIFGISAMLDFLFRR